MGIPFEVARANAWSDESSSFLELLSSDGLIDLTNPLVRLMPVSTLALAIAAAAIRKRNDASASSRELELEASLAAEPAMRGASVAPRSDVFRHAIEGETQ